MVQYKIGDVIGECPDDQAQVTYNGGTDAKCQKCGVVYTVDLEEGEEFQETPPPPPKEEKKEPKRNVGKLNDLVISTPVPKAIPKLLEVKTSVTQAKELGIPDYILKSRPWKWAHEMNMTGNPYKQDSKNWLVFNEIVKDGPINSAMLVARLEQTLGDQMSYLLLIYEVVTQCIACGLLSYDEEKRLISVCQKPAKPAKRP